MASARTIIVIGTIFSFLSFLFLLLVNLGTSVIQSIYIMKIEANNTVVQLGLYGSCVRTGFTNSFHPESIIDCAKGGLLNVAGSSSIKFFAAMHLIGNFIHSFN